jgi:hypothetical protein
VAFYAVREAAAAELFGPHPSWDSADLKRRVARDAAQCQRPRPLN